MQHRCEQGHSLRHLRHHELLAELDCADGEAQHFAPFLLEGQIGERGQRPQGLPVCVGFGGHVCPCLHMHPALLDIEFEVEVFPHPLGSIAGCRQHSVEWSHQVDVVHIEDCEDSR
eukprot:2860855-Rhodomonas_salina.1